MNGLDTAILVVVGLSALLGAIRGMLTEVLSLLVWVAALWLTVAFGDALAAEFTGIATPLLRSLAGYGATFALVVIVGNLLVWLLRTLLHGAGLSGTDRMLGFGFGAARGYAIVLAVVLLVSFTPWSRAALWRESSLMPMFTTPAGWIVAQLPDSSELVAFARPALNALPAVPSTQGIDLSQATQWVGVAPQHDPSQLLELAAKAGLLGAAAAPTAGDPARITPGALQPVDPARVGHGTTSAEDPADIQQSPESN